MPKYHLRESRPALSFKLLDITLILLLWGTIIPGTGYSQKTSNNLVSKTINVGTKPFIFDTLSIDESSFKIIGQKIDDFEIDYLLPSIQTKKGDSLKIEIEYRTLAVNFTKEYAHKSLDQISSKDTTIRPFTFSTAPKGDNVFLGNSIKKSGSISRGAMFGNNQDFSLNSNLNMQLTGKINPEISIQASITDNNLPIQPEGNSQQLQDFDQVYIKLFTDQWKLTAGDFWMKTPKDYFLKYNKRGQGASYEFKSTSPRFGGMKNTNSVSAAISKGKFARNSIQGVEGNQGPYKLRGSENEQFIILLSGTESVYIDGRKLTRGQDNDYVIDYNTAEITFTPNQMITKDRRIVVEFQYSDKNFARSILTSKNTFQTNKWKLSLNAYSEQDSKNQPLQQELSQNERDLLSIVGDNLLDAVISSPDSVGYSTNQVLYAKYDSLGYEIYEYNTNSDSALYQVVFSDVGVGNGHYIEDEFSAFGRVYKWVAPDTISGVIHPNGTYEPVKILVTPKKRQMFTLAAERSLSANTKIKLESALSNSDLNTFSSLNSEDNLGYAFKGSLESKKTLNKLQDWKLKSSLGGEYVHKNFSRIERFRSVEFERNWNLLNFDQNTDQIISEGNLNLSHLNKGKINYRLKSFHLKEFYNGINNQISIDYHDNIDVKLDGSYLLSSGPENTSFLRHKSNISKGGEKFRIGFIDEHEMNQFSTLDSLHANSYQFYDWQVFVQNGDSAVNKLKVYYRERRDRIASNNLLKNTALARNPGLSFDLQKNRNNKLSYNLGYRSLTILDTSLINQNEDQTLLNRIDYQLRLLKGAIQLKTFYEIGSGLELKKEFIYIEVPAGQGVYTWIDYDGDGIKDLNEFEVGAFPDQRTYLRVFTPSDEYVKVFSNQFNQIVNINPSRYFRGSSKLHKTLRRFSSQTALQGDKKTSSNNFSSLINPLDQNINDSTLQSLSSNFRTSTFFNRTNQKFGLEHTFKASHDKFLLVNGFDARSIQTNTVKLRVNLTRKFMLQSAAEQSVKSNSSEYAPSRTYALNIASIKNKFTYQPSTTFRISTKFDYTEKFNFASEGGESVYISDFGAEAKFNKVKKGSINASINYVLIKYNGASNTPIAFEMLDAFQPGSNIAWTGSIQRTLANNLQLILNYNGRTNGEFLTQTGGVQIRAFF